MDYRWEATSPDGLVSQLVRYVATGHYFYFSGSVPVGRDAGQLDEKLLATYGVRVAPWTRSRRRQRGVASVHYLRHDQRFVLLSTTGAGPFFDHLGERRDAAGNLVKQAQFRDIRRVALELDAYAIRSTACSEDLRRGRARRRVLVRLNRATYTNLKAYFLREAHRHPRARLESMVWSLGFYPYRPVLEQLWAVVRAVNRTRRRVGLEELDAKRCIRRRKPPLRVFDAGARTSHDPIPTRS